jgi:hypothetical protein
MAASGVAVGRQGRTPFGRVVSKNMDRRHLNKAQRTMIAATVPNMKQGARNNLAHGCANLNGESVAGLTGPSRQEVRRRPPQRAVGARCAGSWSDPMVEAPQDG